MLTPSLFVYIGSQGPSPLLAGPARRIVRAATTEAQVTTGCDHRQLGMSTGPEDRYEFSGPVASIQDAVAHD